MTSQYRTGAVSQTHLTGEYLVTEYGLRNSPAGLHVNGVSTPDVPCENRLFFLDRLDEEGAAKLSEFPHENMVFVLPKGAVPGQFRHAFIEADVPREVYSALVSEMFDYRARFIVPHERIAAGCEIHPTAVISQGAIIGEQCVIGEDVQILPNAVIGPNCRIGARSVIRSGAVIGQPGFGGFKNSSGRLQHLPHVGGVVIESDVEIGGMTTVASGTIHPTIVEHEVKIDDRVHIAHNCRIGTQSQIVAHAEVSGSVVVGPRVWIGPNVAIRDGLTIGADAFIGMGAIVTKDVEPLAKMGGNPARRLGPV